MDSAIVLYDSSRPSVPEWYEGLFETSTRVICSGLEVHYYLGWILKFSKVHAAILEAAQLDEERILEGFGAEDAPYVIVVGEERDQNRGINCRQEVAGNGKHVLDAKLRSRYTPSVTQLTLVDFLEDVAVRYGVSFVFDPSTPNRDDTVIEIGSPRTLGRAIEECLSATGLSFTVREGVLYVTSQPNDTTK